MQTVFLLFLFILQIIGFYFIALLYMKISKFNNLEKKQQKLMAEMDDAIGAYLSELKLENERLISIIEKQQANDERAENASASHSQSEPMRPIEQKKAFSITTPAYPLKAALKTYQTAPSLNNPNVNEQERTDTEKGDRTIAIHMYDEGKPIEEIAKRLGKGKTEVELLLKFR